MKTIAKILALLLTLGLPCSASAQTTTTVGGLTTATSGNFTATSSMLVNASGTDYQFTPNTLAKVVLNNLTISNGGSSIFSLTGIVSSGTTTLGVLTLTQTTTGVLTLSSLIVNSAGATGWTQSLLQIVPTTTSAIVSANLTGTGGILFGRNSGGGSSISTSSGITSTNLPAGITYGITATDTNIYLKAEAGRSVYFLDGSLGYVGSFGNSTGFVLMSSAGSNFSGLYTSTASYLKTTAGTTGSLGTFYTGGFGSGFRAVSSSTAMTITDSIMNITASGITVTLADSTSLTGRHSIFINSSAGTSTVAGLTATQTINGATTLSVPANTSLRVISTGTINLSY